MKALGAQLRLALRRRLRDTKMRITVRSFSRVNNSTHPKENETLGEGESQSIKSHLEKQLPSPEFDMTYVPSNLQMRTPAILVV